jgi:hypothetical protein
MDADECLHKAESIFKGIGLEWDLKELERTKKQLADR